MSSLNKIISKYFNNKFLKNVAYLVGGTAGAQLLMICFAPFVTRIFGPKAYGVLGEFIAISNLMIPVAALTYPIAIVLPKKDEDALNIVKLSVFVSMMFSIIVFIVLSLKYENINLFIGISQSLRDYIIFIPIAVFFGGIQQIYEQWNIRNKHFKITAHANIIQTVIVNLITIIVGVSKPFAYVLVIGATVKGLLYGVIVTVLSEKINKQEGGIKNLLLFDAKKIKSIGREYYDFPVYRAPQVFINALSQSIPVLMLASMYGHTYAGYYAIGRAVLGLPTQLVGKSVADVFYPRFVEARHNANNISKLLKKTIVWLTLVAVIPYGSIIIGGPWIFKMVFGDEWYIAGQYAQWLSFMSFFTFISRPSIIAIPVLNMQKTLLLFEVYSIVLRVLGFFIGYYWFKTDISAVIGFSLAGGIIYMQLMWIVFTKSLKYNFVV
ncbi:MAG: oligosaccharide flippase family protein [Bacteroidetes bacterium]|nr:oligosaccharide flippase family protein [Bacteroidota bacterium]